MKDNLFDVSKDTVVITGVSGQLGAQYAGAFLDRGANVFGIDLKPSKRLELLESSHSKKFRFFQADITKKSSVSLAHDSCVKEFGNPTVLVNNAAIDSPPFAPSSENGPFEDYPEESWDTVLNVNLKGVFLCCQIIGSSIAVHGGGSIINIASIYGVVSPDQSIYEYRRKRGDQFYKPIAYSASKSGIINLTRYLAVYWSKRSTRVNSLTIAGVYNSQDQEFLDAYTKRIPIGRMAQIDEYNGSVIFLASKASNYLTGHNLVVDGGWTAI